MYRYLYHYFFFSSQDCKWWAEGEGQGQDPGLPEEGEGSKVEGGEREGGEEDERKGEEEIKGGGQEEEGGSVNGD